MCTSLVLWIPYPSFKYYIYFIYILYIYELMSKIYLVHGFMYFVQWILTIYILTLVTFGSLVLSSFSSENRSLFAWHWTQPLLLNNEWRYDLEMNHTRVSGHSSELNMFLKLGYSMYLMTFSVIRSFLLSQSHKV